jgi:hypothetical protein
MAGLAEAFAHFGTAGKSQRGSSSARTPDGRAVVMTLWKDILDYTTKPISYNTYGRTDLPEWTDKPGNLERIDNLLWARDQCDGMFRVVIAVAENIRASPRKIADCYPQNRMVMKLLDVDEQTGEFRAVNVGK